MDRTDVAAYLLDPDAEWEHSTASDRRPLGFIELERCGTSARLDRLPSFPVIGLGDPAHALAPMLDAVIEPPISAAAVLRQVRQNPHAASVAVHLLRALAGVPTAHALGLESLAYGLLQGSAEHATWLAGRQAPSAGRPGGVRLEREDATLRVTIVRPWARNAIDRSLRDALGDAFEVAAHDASLRRIELRAVGRAFSIGGELSEFGTTRDPATAHLIRQRTLPAGRLADRAACLDVHVQGACIGAGLELAAFAGRLTAAPDAWFQLPELAMGLIPGAGGCVSVPRRIGRQRATLMILSGRRIGAETALAWGLVDAIVDQPAVDQPAADEGGADPHRV